MISIVIPIYNEEANIDKLTESILTALSGIEYEVLFINDGSTDSSEKKNTRESLLMKFLSFRILFINTIWQYLIYYIILI